MPEFFQPGNPDIGFSGRDQDQPSTGLSMGSSEALRKIGETIGGENGFENVSSAVDREYGSQIRDTGLLARVMTLEARMAVGAELYDTFNRVPNASVLGVPTSGTTLPWIQFGDGQNLGIEDEAAQINRDSLFGVLPNDGTRYALTPVAASANDYTISVAIHPRITEKISGRARTSIYGRCNAAGTEGVYVDFFAGSCAIGRFTRSGTALNRTQWLSNVQRSYSYSSSPELKMVGNRYLVQIDGVTVLDVEDTSGFPVDGNHRYSMFSLMCWTGILLQKPEFSAGITAFSIRGANLTAIEQATTAASNAEAAAGAVLGIAENADAKATAAQATANSVEDIALAAQTSADVAYAAAARWKDEFIVASAGVVLGKNELALGVVMDVPSGRTRKISRIIYGLITNTGAMTVQLISTSPTRVSTVIHTTTIPAGVVEFIDNSPDISVTDGHRISCNVTNIGGNSSVLQCAIIGALI